MREDLGQVKFNERQLNDRLQRYCDEQVRHWLKTHDIEVGAEPADYEVSFFDEETLGEISCLIVVQSGPRMWKSWETADNPREAFCRSLESLESELPH